MPLVDTLKGVEVFSAKENESAITRKYIQKKHNESAFERVKTREPYFLGDLWYPLSKWMGYFSDMHCAQLISSWGTLSPISWGLVYFSTSWASRYRKVSPAINGVRWWGVTGVIRCTTGNVDYQARAHAKLMIVNNEVYKGHSLR